MTELEWVRRARSFAGRVAVTSDGHDYSYESLLSVSGTIAANLLEGSPDLGESRVAFLIPASFEYVAVQWGIWRAGGIAVPLSLSAADPELEHVITDARVDRIIVREDALEGLRLLCERLSVPLVSFDRLSSPPQPVSLPQLGTERRAMILYTSGTTSKPKGVVSTHANIQAQITTLVEAWGWRSDDWIPLFLPLHHVHGIVNVQGCALWSGARVDCFDSFDARVVLERVAAKDYSVFMAVPTIYVKLIRLLEAADESDRVRYTDGFAHMRLMVSGSAALPASVHEQWTGLTGQKLLERYGMTEIGMALSNPLHGERRPGAVGEPLPGVAVRLIGEAGGVIQEEGVPGEIQVRGPAVFSEYWDKPDVTRESFVDGWFSTGDMAVLEDGYYRIMGRLSVDIIKSGGYKLSALEIEDTLRTHPAIRECAVVGMPDDTWGEAVAVAIVPRDGKHIDLPALKEWAAERMSGYKIPKSLLLLEDLPRNAMGKVTKPAVQELFG
jgi:malonyl-CoA/methylmalonyl-CoA synthetase